MFFYVLVRNCGYGDVVHGRMEQVMRIVNL